MWLGSGEGEGLGDGERFVDAVERLGPEPFKRRVYDGKAVATPRAVAHA